MVAFVILLVLWLLCWRFLDSYNWEDINDFDFSLSDEVYLQWELRADGDIITHTHTIEDKNYWTVFLKSDSINLYDYVWFVELTWVVEKFYQWDPIVKVLMLSWSVSGTWDNVNMAFNGNGWVYIKSAWIQLLPSFFDTYVLLNEWENGKILIQNIESWKEIALDYFRCNASDPNKNCKWLKENFVSNNAQSFVTSEWDVYYKQSEVQSWFVANWDWWWIFINDVSDDVIFELKDLIKFANQKNMNEWVKSSAVNICQWSWERLQKINNSEIMLRQEWLVVMISWDWQQKQMTCQILVDFGLPAKWELLDLVLWNDIIPSTWDDIQRGDDNVVVESLWEISSMSDNSKFDTNVAQFPIKEEWLKYSSSRWGYILQFPSSNISYAASSVKENFWRNDISCSYVINVIKYSEKENLEISPAVRVYECSGKVDKSWAPNILVYPRAGKVFVVQMNDGAWYDFSMHLKISSLME